jgi:hypothetical protein
LIRVDDGQVRFRHPLVEYAVLDGVGAGAERGAHRLLAAGDRSAAGVVAPGDGN